MAEYTENLNLKKPAQDEQYNVDDFNDNFDKIDDFAGIVPPRALTADKLTSGAKINGVNFKGDTDVITGLGLYSDTNTYNNTNLAYLYDNGKLKIFQSIRSGNIGHNPLNSPIYWTEIQIGSKRHYGETVTSSLPIIDDDTLHLADGSLLSASDYPGFSSYISNLYTETPDWEQLTSGLVGNNWGCCTYGNNKAVALTYTTEDEHVGGYAVRNGSSASSTWSTYADSTLYNCGCTTLAYGNGYYISICSFPDEYSSDSKRICYSTDGINWTKTSSRIEQLGTKTWKIAYGRSKFVAISSDGYVSTSQDGLSWTSAVQNANLGPNYWRSIEFDGINFTAIGQNGYISKSQDGTTWAVATHIGSLGYWNWISLSYGNGKYVAVSREGYVSTSTNGVVWTPPRLNANLISSEAGYIVDMLYDQSKQEFMVLTNGGYISYSIEVNGAFTSEENWQATYATYGECGKYVYNPTAHTIRLPLYNSYFTNTVNPQKVGDLTEASLPNIKATVKHLVLQDADRTFDWTGAFYNAGIGDVSYRPSSITNVGSNLDNIGFDAHRSSTIYSDTATTVNTQSIKQLVYIVVKA